MAEDSIKFISFVTPDWLTRQLHSFHRFINLVFKPLLDAGEILIYLDDILIATSTVEKKLSILRDVLKLSKHDFEAQFPNVIF